MIIILSELSRPFSVPVRGRSYRRRDSAQAGERSFHDALEDLPKRFGLVVGATVIGAGDIRFGLELGQDPAGRVSRGNGPFGGRVPHVLHLVRREAVDLDRYRRLVWPG